MIDYTNINIAYMHDNSRLLSTFFQDEPEFIAEVVEILRYEHQEEIPEVLIVKYYYIARY